MLLPVSTDESSGCPPFDALRRSILDDPRLAAELHSALVANVRWIDTSSFVGRTRINDATRWLITAAALASGAFDEADVGRSPDPVTLDRHVSQTWSVRWLSTARTDRFRLGRFPASAALETTGGFIFAQPGVLPGLVFANKRLHADLDLRRDRDREQQRKSLEVWVSGEAVLSHAGRHPACLIPLPGGSAAAPTAGDSFLLYAQRLLSLEGLPVLSASLARVATNRAAEVQDAFEFQRGEPTP